MSVIIRLQGLPWSASAMNIRHFFSGLSIPAGGVHIIGGDGGDAFIAFSSDDDARMAMKKNMCCLNDTPIQLFLSSKSEMQSVIDAARSGASSQAVSSVQQAAPSVTSNAPPVMTSASHVGMQQEHQRSNSNYPPMDMQKSNMQQIPGSGNEFGSQMQQNQWQGFHGGAGAGDGADQSRQHSIMGQQQQHGMGGYPDGANYQFPRGGDNQMGNRGYTNQGMDTGGTMLDQQGRGMTRGPMMGEQAMHGQGQRAGRMNQGQGGMEGQMESGLSADRPMNQQDMGYGNTNQQGARQNQGNQEFVNQYQMGGPRQTGMNQGENRGPFQGNMMGRPPFNQDTTMEQNQSGFGSMAGRQSTGGDNTNAGMGMNVPPSSMPGTDRFGNRFPRDTAMREFDKERTTMTWSNSASQDAQTGRARFPGDMNLDRANQDSPNPSNPSSQGMMGRPFLGQGGMYGPGRRPGMPPNQYAEETEEELLPSTSYPPPDEPSLDTERDARMSERPPNMQTYNRENRPMGGPKFHGADQFMGKGREIDRGRFSGHDSGFSLEDHPERNLRPGADERMGSFGPGGNRFPPNKHVPLDDQNFQRRPDDASFPSEVNRYNRDRGSFERGRPNDPWDRHQGPTNHGENRGQFPPDILPGDRRDFRDAFGRGNQLREREPGRRGPSRWDTAKESTGTDSEPAAQNKSSLDSTSSKPEKSTSAAAIADKDQRTGSMERSKIDCSVEDSAKAKATTTDIDIKQLDTGAVSRASSIGKVGQGLEGRGSMERKGETFEGRRPPFESTEQDFEGQGPGFEERRPGYGDRGPGFQNRRPEFDQRNLEFEGRQGGLEHRRPGFGGRFPGFEEGRTGYEERGAGYDGRDPGFEGRGPGFEGRGPAFEARGPRFEGRGRGFEGRGRGFEGRGPRFEAMGPDFERFEERGPGFEGRGPGFERRRQEMEMRHGEMSFENRRPGPERFEDMDVEGREKPGLESQGRQEFERRMRFEGRQGRYGYEGGEDNRMGPPYEGRHRFEGRGPGFEGRRGPGFEGAHELDMDRRNDPDFDGREPEMERMRGAGYGRGGPGMRGRGSDGMRGRGGPGPDMQRSHGFPEDSFDRPSHPPYGDSEMEDFDNRIPGRGGPSFDRPFRGRGDPFFRGRGGPPGPFGRGRGMELDRFEDASLRDIDARNIGGRPDVSAGAPKGLLGDAPQQVEPNEERTRAEKNDEERRQDRHRSDSSSRRDGESRRRSYERDRDSDRDRRYDDRRGRDRDDRRYDDRCRHRFGRDRYRRSRSRSSDRSRDRDRYSSTGKSGSPRTRTEPRNRSLIVKNMPLTVNYKEVRRFFHPYDIPFDGLKIINNEKGERIGVAYVQLRRSDDFQKALGRNGDKMGTNIVSITACTEEEFSKAVDSFVPPISQSTSDVSNIKLPPTPGEDKPANAEKMRYILQLKNLPQSITKQDILQFFQGVVIDNNGQSAYIEFDSAGIATGLGFVEVKSDSDYKKALTFDNSKIGSNAIKVLPGKSDEADDLKGKQLEMLQRAALRNVSGAKVMGPGGHLARPGLMGPRPGVPPQQAGPGRAIGQPQPQMPNPNQTRPQGPPQAPGSAITPRPLTNQPQQQGSGQGQSPGTVPVRPKGPMTPQDPQQQQPKKTPQSPAKSVSQEEAPKPLDTVCVHIQGLPLLATPQDIRQFFGESQIALRGINIAHDSRGKPLGEGFVEFRGRADFDKALKKDKTSLGRHIVAVKPISKKDMLERLGISRKVSEPSPNKAEEVKNNQNMGQGLLSTPVTSTQNNSAQQQSMPRESPSSASSGPQSQNGAPQPGTGISQPQQLQQRPKPLMSSSSATKGPEMLPAPGPVPAPGPANKSIPPGVLNQNWFYVRCQNFPPDISISEILHFFQSFRPLGHSIRLHYSSDGKPTGNAVVGFAHREEAERALVNLNMKRCRQNPVSLFPA